MNQTPDIQVLFEDAALLVINKPAGLATLPDGYNPALPHIKSMLQQQFGPLWIVHRLDKGTSGVLLLARTAQVHHSLNSQFEHHLVSKVYHALVVGNPEWQEKTISLPLRPNGDRQHRTVVDLQNGKPALTHLEVLERYDGYSLVEAIPETGRTHQIRAHLFALSLTIVGDRLYTRRIANREERNTHSTTKDHEPSIHWIEGMMLHARSLEITHPASGERLKFIAPYPDTWIAVIQQLRSPVTGVDREIQ